MIQITGSLSNAVTQSSPSISGIPMLLARREPVTSVERHMPRSISADGLNPYARRRNRSLGPRRQ